jgi:uncharacterized protein (TIGR03118 family)
MDEEERGTMIALLQGSLRQTVIALLCVLMVCVVPSLYAGGKFYLQRNLVSDGFVPAEHTDSNLVNPWRIAFNPNGFVWVANNQTGVATLYDGEGILQSPIVTIPPAPGSTDPGNPTGIVFNGSPDFVISKGNISSPSRFIFASENGTIAAWASNVDLTNALLVIDNSNSEAIYKGLALAASGTGNFLYATDFHHGKIDVFDKAFQPATLAGTFSDPDLPGGFAPFGIRNINGALYVTYAMQDEEKEDDVAGQGLGFVNVFDADGQLIRRFASRGHLNAPWGLALAPADFGKFSNRLLIGNFGDGAINAYDLATGEFRGRLHHADGQEVAIDGLWGIGFGNGIANQPTNVLFFAAGPDDEIHGLYGRIEPASDHNSDDAVAVDNESE